MRDDGVALGWGRHEGVVPAQQRSFGGSGRSHIAIQQAIEQALGEWSGEELHLVVQMSWTPIPVSAKRVPRLLLHTVSEYQAAYAQAGETSGLVVLAGTGAFVHGLPRDGKYLHLDGLGPMLGDFGSGYHIGVMAAQAAARSGWHPRHFTTLADAIYRACGGREGDPFGASLIAFMHGNRDRAEIASLARIVDGEARTGDRVAREILEAAADALAETLWDVIDRLGIVRDAYPLIGIGGIITHSAIYWERLCLRAAEFAPHLTPQRLELPPVVGAVLPILEQLGAVPPAAARANLLTSVRELLEVRSAECGVQNTELPPPPARLHRATSGRT